MSFPAPVANGVNTNADQVNVIVTSAQFANIVAMAAKQTYLFVSTTACWIQQGANPTAAATPGSMFVPANVQVLIDGALGAKLAVIRDAADGKASLTRCKMSPGTL